MGKYLTDNDFTFDDVQDYWNDFMLITSSVGKGKSTYAAQSLKDKIEHMTDKKIRLSLMLVPYTNLKVNLTNLNSEHFKLADKIDFIKPDVEDTRIRVMTVQQFGMWIQEDIIIELPDLIIFDEVHRMFKDASYQEQTAIALICLRERWNEFIAVGMTATPQYLEYIKRNQYLDFNFIDITPDKEPVIIAKDFKVVLGAAYNHYLDQMKHINEVNKIVIYIESKREVVRLVQKCRERGYKADGIVSIYNSDEHWEILGESSKAAREHLLATGEVIPDILVINRSCVEGITIDDPRVKTMFIQAPDLMTIEQAYGRVRSSLNLVMVFVNNSYRAEESEHLHISANFFKVDNYTQEELMKSYEMQDNDNRKELLKVIKIKDKYYKNVFLPSSIQYNCDTYISINSNGNRLYIDGVEFAGNAFEYYGSLAKYCERHFEVQWNINMFEMFSELEARKNWMEVENMYVDIKLDKDDKDRLCGLLNITKIKKHPNGGNEYVVAKWPTARKFLVSLGYVVEDKKSGNKRWSVISK